MAKITVTVYPSRVRKRVWLKAVDDQGNALVIENILRQDMVKLRNELVERLAASGKYDEVNGDPINFVPATEPRNPWTNYVDKDPTK